MAGELFIGMGFPYFVAAEVANTADFNTAIVTSSTLEVTKPRGSSVTWATSVVEQSPLVLRVRHDLVVPDLDEVGTWRVWLRGLIPGGFQRSYVGSFRVYPTNHLL